MPNELKDLRVAILVAEGFEQQELTEPRSALDDAGAQTKIVSPSEGQVQGWKHFDKADKFPVDVPLTQAKASDFDACFCPAASRTLIS
jgi:protease I